MTRNLQVRIAGTILLTAVSLACGTPLLRAEATPQTTDLSQLSLEDLTKVEVSSVSRKEQELFKTPAAVFVITHDEIRRSGIRSLPELLRMVPGMQVAQLYANEWAVSSRGFNGRFADKMLVLIDGRSIYSEIYSGVHWDQNDLLLEDIDRVEVIRGPGGSLWGANAVNGIINIITLKASQTRGALLIGQAGRLDDEGAARVGGSLGKQFQYRSYAKFLQRNQLVTATGTGAGDAGTSERLGARADWKARPADSIVFQGDLYRGRSKERVTLDGSTAASSSKIETAGGFALARWEHTFAHFDTALQSYYNQEDRGELSGSAREGSYDLDFIAHLPRFRRNDATTGAGFRVTTDRIKGTPPVFGHPRHRDNLTSFFFEDDLAIVPGKFAVTGGLKMLDTSYTGIEVQPSARALWTPDERHTIWVSASRAVRTPSVQERDLLYLRALPTVGPVPTSVLAEGNTAFKSEVVQAYETGYRQSFSKWFSVDVAGFYNRYKSLRSQTQLDPYVVTSPEFQVIVPVVYGNRLKARSDGVEVAAGWTPRTALRMDVAYSWINSRLWLNTLDAATTGDSWSTPTNTLSVRETWEFARHWSLYSSLYTVTRLPKDLQVVPSQVGPYFRVDTHLSLNLNDRLRVIAGGDNLQEARHLEINPASDGYSVGSYVPRSAFVKVEWSF